MITVALPGSPIVTLLGNDDGSIMNFKVSFTSNMPTGILCVTFSVSEINVTLKL